MQIGKKSFTLLELMVVLTILGFLYQTVSPLYRKSLIQAKESALKKNLYHMRKAIDLYYREFELYPHKLHSLVEARYLRHIPVDPFTQKSDTWETIPSIDGGQDIFDIHSGSSVVGLNQIPYSKW